MLSCSVFQKSHGMGRVQSGQHKDSTVCTASVCVCVTSGSDVIPSHFHPHTHTLVSAVCHWIKPSFSCRLSAATSARTHSDRHFCLFCRCRLALSVLRVRSHAGLSLRHCLFPTFSLMSQSAGGLDLLRSQDNLGV